MDKRAVLYQLESPSGKLYMGITTRFKHRMNQHARSVGGRTALARAITKYGFGNFKQAILCNGSLEYIKDLEIKSIKSFGSRHPNGYNLTSGGDHWDIPSEYTSCYGKLGRNHPAYGNKLSAGARTRISQYQSGTIRSSETRAKMAKSKLGNIYGSLRVNTAHSTETKDKLSRSHLGKTSPRKGSTLDSDTRELISLASRHQWGSRKYLVSDGRAFFTLRELCEVFGYTASGMSKAVKFGRVLPGGFTVSLKVEQK